MISATKEDEEHAMAASGLREAPERTEAVVLPPRRRRGPRPGYPTRRPGGLKFGHWWWALPGVLLVIGVHYAATIAGGMFAFTDWTGIGDFAWVGLANFVEIFSNAELIGSVRNTLVIAFAAVILGQAAGLTLALALNRVLKTRYILRVLFFMPVVLSSLAMSYIWRFIFDYNGPLNSFLTAVGLESWVRPWLADPNLAIWTIVVVMVWESTGTSMIIYLAGLTAVPIENEEAAALDGANLFQRFRYVIFPAIRPAVAISLILQTMSALRVFDPIIALTGGGPAGATETLSTQVYQQAFAIGRFGLGAALALILALIVLAFALLQQRLTRDRATE